MDKPLNLGSRGEKLWDAVTSERDFDAAGACLFEDCCRTVDLIDSLSEMLYQSQDDWLEIVAAKRGEDIKTSEELALNIHPLLSEIRQQRLAMRQLMAQLGIGKLAGEENLESKQAREFWANTEAQF